MAVTVTLTRATFVSTALVFAATPALAATAARAPYGATAAGAPVEVFTLTNDRGMNVKVLSYGGVITQVNVPDRKGEVRNVVLELADLKAYEARANFSSLLGRYANRISNGGFTLDGVRHDLPSGAEGVSSHGGPTGFSTRLWTATPFQRRGEAGVTLAYTAADGEGGYPGTLKVAVTYTVTRKNVLRIDYRATTDKPTVINLSHHVYFNLAGGGTVYDHTIQALASRFTPIDARKLPTGEIAPVAGTALDLRRPVRLGDRVAADDPQIRFANGLDHNFVVDGGGRGGLVPAVRLADPASGRTLEVATTQPGVQLFAANSFNGTLKTPDGRPLEKGAGLAIETQHFADSPNHPNFPTTVLRPGETFSQTTEFRFGAAPQD
ncbi:aldose epimerase family protein [Caulobacter sp. UNC279MFTsu5.1]|uniref:aldose epimerase family protein n=1 Tax=Caulobacter sp. UNC279MFTsu5.1 TaxID=1502775 RepID=UPI000B7FAB2C|nr:aldose epimerase family protein [Caulobacter sp. UNC279MFTsu5.1]